MKKIKKWLNQSFYTKPLSPACRMCAEGSKMVLLVTGLCPADCFYCPLSFEKKGQDRIFADEWELKDENDFEKIFLEAKYIDAKGAGITGGDPLQVWRRTKNYISFLKKNFGEKFHIHLYTSGVKNTEHIPDLVSAGLDEIRFHPNPFLWDKMDKNPYSHAFKKALDADVDVAIEIPCIPDKEIEIISMIKWADSIGIKWINLNELEYSETNAEELNRIGYTVKDDISAAVKNSEGTALKIINTLSKVNLSVGIHYCSSSFKDGIQLRNRIMRRAKNIATDIDIITEDGTLLKAVIEPDDQNIEKILVFLITLIDKDKIFLNKEKNRIELHIKTLKKISKNLKEKNIKSYIIEQYPTADSLEVERMPIS